MSIKDLVSLHKDDRLAESRNNTNKDHSCFRDGSTPPVSVIYDERNTNFTPIQQINPSCSNNNLLGKETALGDCGGRPPPTSIARHFDRPFISSSLITSSPSPLLPQQEPQLERRTSQPENILTPILQHNQCRPQMSDSPETEAQQQQTKLQHSLQADTDYLTTVITCDNIPSKLADELFDHNQHNQQDSYDPPTKFQLRALSNKPITFASATKQHRYRQEEKILEQLREDTTIKKDKHCDKRPYPTESDLVEINNLLLSDTANEEEVEDKNNFKTEFLGLDVHTRDLIAKLESDPWIQTPALPPNLHITNLSHEVISETLNYFVICGERLTLMTKTYDDIDAVVKLLQEKEVDLELAARIGQDLLEQNKQLKSSIHELEEELTKRKEDVQQLKHELASKSSLLQTFIEEEEDDEEHYPSYQSEAKESLDQRNLPHTETSEPHSTSFLIANEAPDLITSKRHLISNDINFESDSDLNDDRLSHSDCDRNHQSKSICQNESMIASSPLHKEKSWHFNRLVSNHQDEITATTIASQQHHYYPDQHQSLKNCVVTGNNSNTKYSEKLGKENEILQRTGAILNTVRLTEKDNEEQRLLVQNVTLQLVESNKRLCELQEELAIKSELNQQQQERIQSLLTQLRDSDRRVNEIGSENDSLQNSIRASLECQKELADELKDCKRNLSELLSVFVELQQESKRYRLANRVNKVPQALFGPADTITTSITSNDGACGGIGTPFDERDQDDEDIYDNDADNSNNYLLTNNKPLPTTTNDVSPYSQSLPFDLSDGKKRVAEGFLDCNATTSTLLSEAATNVIDKQTVRSTTTSREYEYFSRSRLNGNNTTSAGNHDDTTIKDANSCDIETPTAPPLPPPSPSSSLQTSSNLFVNVVSGSVEQEETHKSSSNHHNHLLLKQTRHSNNCSPADSLAAEIASTLESTASYYNNRHSSHQHNNPRTNKYNQQQQQLHSITNTTDSEDASLGYESENSTTASTTASSGNPPGGYITNGRRRPRRYQHRQQQQQQVQNNFCCPVSAASVVSSQSIISGNFNQVNSYYRHHHCNCHHLRESESPLPAHTSSCQPIACDCAHRFAPPVPICLHGNVNGCMGGQAASHRHQCIQQQQQQQSLGSVELQDNSRHTFHDHHQEKQQQQQHNANIITYSTGPNTLSSNVDANIKQQQVCSTVDNVSASGSNATPPIIIDSAKTTVVRKAQERSLPNNSLLSNKLRLIKMMEGSKYLKQWERLASLDLGSILKTESAELEAQSHDLNSINGNNTNQHQMSLQEDSYEYRRQNAAATMATLSGLRSQLLSQISLSSSNESRASRMIDDSSSQQLNESSSSTTATSTPSIPSSSSLLTSCTTTTTTSANDDNQSEMMIDVGSGGTTSLHEMVKRRSCLQTSALSRMNGFNLLLSKGAPSNDNTNTCGGSQSGLGALLGNRAAGRQATTSRVVNSGNNKLLSNQVLNQTQQAVNNVSNALRVNGGNKDDICGGIITSTLSLRAQGGPPLSMDDMRRKLRLTDSSSDSDSEENQSQSRKASCNNSSARLLKEDDHAEDRKGSSDINGHIIDIITVLTAVIIGINENFGDPMLH